MEKAGCAGSARSWRVASPDRQTAGWSPHGESSVAVNTMGLIQVALSDAAKAEALRTVLARSTRTPVQCVERPDLDEACAVVVDPAHLGLLPVPLSHPHRVVLVAPRSGEENLREAWELGVGSVVNEHDPVDTVVLAVLAVCLRTGPGREQPAAPEAGGARSRRETKA